MKVKTLLVFSLVFSTVFVLSCSKDESVSSKSGPGIVVSYNTPEQ